MAMRTVNSGDVYDKKRFVDAMKDLSDLGGTLEKVSSENGHWNPDARKNLGTLLRDNQTFYSGLQPDSVINDSQEAHKQYERDIQNYTITNFSTLLKKVDAETLLGLVTSILPIDKTKDKGLNKIIELINERRKIAKATKEGDTQSYVMEKLANASEWRQRAFFGYSVGDSNYIEKTFNEYAQSVEQDFRKEVFEADKKTIKSGKLRSILEENYKQFIAKDTEVADKLAEAYLSTIAQGAYQTVKPGKRDEHGSIARTGKVAS